MTKLRHAEDYGPEWVALVKETCLFVFPKLNDLIDDITIVGGAVPSLLLGETLPPNVPPHVGTTDLDLCLGLAVGSGNCYTELVRRLRELGFESSTGSGAGTRWTRRAPGEKKSMIDLLPVHPQGVTIDTLPIAPLRESVTRQLELAGLDRLRVRISDPPTKKSPRCVEPWICGPGAFIVIKTLTYEDRNEPKDAYDMFYVLRNYGSGIGDVVARLAPLLREPEGRRGIGLLEKHFLDENDDGPRAVALFLFKKPHPETQADVVSFVRQLLQACGVNPP